MTKKRKSRGINPPLHKAKTDQDWFWRECRDENRWIALWAGIFVPAGVYCAGESTRREGWSVGGICEAGRDEDGRAAALQRDRGPDFARGGILPWIFEACSDGGDVRDQQSLLVDGGRQI